MSRVSGIAALAKPAGVTSFAALSPLKKKLDLGKVGHTGTLDRFATGLLVVLVGSYSHLTPFFSSLGKSYRAKIRFGLETATLDPEGEVVAEAAVPSRDAIDAVLDSFRGPILQRPPVYSALHVNGKRAYERALKGEILEMPARPIVIKELNLVSYDGLDAEVFVSCSSGTYIRSLARDIGLACGSRASLSALCRESIGPFLLADAVAPENFEPERDFRFFDAPCATKLGLRPRIIAAKALRRFLNGGRIADDELSDASEPIEIQPEKAFSAVFSESGDFLGIVEEGAAGLSYRFVVGEKR